MPCLHSVTNEVTYTNREAVSPESSWYGVQTWPRHEKRVATELRQKNLQVFLPLFSDQRQWSDRRVLVDTALFPGYVFVRIPQEPSTRVAVLRTAGVRKFVGMRGVGDPIPDSEIKDVQTLLARRVPFNLFPFLNIGQRVRIRNGSLDGIEGILTAINGDNSLVISVALIQRSLAIRITGYRIEPV